MKWMNKREQLKAILKASGCSIFTILLISMIIWAGTSMPSKIKPEPVDYGPQIMERYPAPVDSELKRLGARHLRTAIADETLQPGARLVRVAICKERMTNLKKIDILKKADCHFFWKETGPNHNYRIIYGSTSAARLPDDTILNEIKSENSQMKFRIVVEKIISGETDILNLDAIN